MRLEVEDRRPVGERRDADGLDVVGQERAAAGERVAAAAAEHDRARTSAATALRRSNSDLTVARRIAHRHHHADERSFGDDHLADRLAGGVRAGPPRRPAPARAARPRDSTGRHGEARAHLAVDLHRHDHFVGLGDLGIERRPGRLRPARRRGRASATAPRPCAARTARSSPPARRSPRAATAIVCGRSTRPTGASPRVGAPCGGRLR